MMNSCSLYRSYLILNITCVLLGGGLIYGSGFGLWTWPVILYGAFVLLLMCLSVYFVRKSISVLSCYQQTISKLSEGDFESRIVGINEKGLLGAFAEKLNSLADIVDAFVREACNSMEAVSEARYYRKVIETGMPGLFRRSALAINAVTKGTEMRLDKFRSNADLFEEKVRGIVENVMLSSKDLQQAAEGMLQTAEITNQESESAANSANQTARGVSVVSTAVGGLSASITEIDQRVTTSVEMAERAQEQASKADELVRGLDQAGRNIGDIIRLITDIAEQTNLLALNATIEAARAGEAGKGFAVVANEVKGLAAQTAKATEEISEQVASIQTATENAVSAIGLIGSTIAEINKMSVDIKTSVNEQMIATQEIAQNANSSSENVILVSGNIDKVGTATIATRAASSQVLSAANGLNSQSTSLHAEVEKFLTNVWNNSNVTTN